MATEDYPLDHVAVVSRDMTADIAFYAQLGFTVETRYGDWAMLRDSTGRGIALLSPEGHHPAHFALRTGSRASVDRLANQMAGRVVEHRDGTVSIYVKDPSGNALEIIYYPEK